MQAPAHVSSPDALRGKSIVLFDGVCVMCNRGMRFALRRDRSDRLRFASLQSRFAAEVAARHGKELREIDTIYVVADYGLSTERLLARSAAVLHIANAFGGAWRIAGVLRAVPASLLDRAYDFVASRRYRWFGRYDTCPIPTPAERAKFVAED
jgi:predicted DCC family thiol-disulfide oxidoreductase YuxK